MEKKKGKIFFPVFLFIGMGVGFMLIESLGGTAFVAAMFIGMGVGFLFDSIITIREKSIKIEPPIKASGFFMVIIGFLFIIGGGLAIVAPELLKYLVTYFIGLGFITAGLIILLLGLKLLQYQLELSPQ